MARTLASGSYLSVLDAPITAYPFTLACRARPTFVGSPPQFKNLFGLWNTTLEIEAQIISMEVDAFRAISVDNNDEGQAYANRAEVANTWVSVVARFPSATERQMVVNADFANEGFDDFSANIPFASYNAIFVGRDAYVGAQYYQGQQAELAIWDEVVPNWVVEAYTKGYSPLKLRFDSLARYWPLRGGNPDRDMINGVGLAISGTPDPFTHPTTIYPRNSKTTLALPPAATGSSPARRRYFHIHSAEGIF
jgi:hypothetical protein